jgi:hypothetical protein
MHASHTTVRQVVHQQLHPYHQQKVQAVCPADDPRRQEFSQWFLQRCAAEPRFPSIVLYTYKKSFNRENIINSHKNQVCEDEILHATLEQGHQQRFSINVWCGIVHDPLIDPYVLPSRLTGPVYRDFLEQSLPELLENVPLHVRRRMWLMHDGAPAHFSM